MEIKTNKELESTGYRCLFECVKQKGIKPVYELIQDIRKIPDNNILIHQTLLNSEKNDLIKLVEKNEDVISYLKEHKEELSGLSLTKKDVSKILISLYRDINLLDMYLENAKKLEELKVSDVEFIYSYEFDYRHGIYRDEDGKITKIQKFYTDGDMITFNERLRNEKLRYSIIPFRILDFTFILEASNSEELSQYRKIHIADFSFDGSSLPTEEEIQSYELPKVLSKNFSTNINR